MVQSAGFAPASPEWRSEILLLEDDCKKGQGLSSHTRPDAFPLRVHPDRNAVYPPPLQDGYMSMAEPSLWRGNTTAPEITPGQKRTNTAATLYCVAPAGFSRRIFRCFGHTSCKALGM